MLVLLFVSPQSGQPLRGFPHAVKHLWPLRGPFIPRFYTYGGVSLSSAAFVETRRATSPFASVFSPMVCRDAFLRLLQRVCHISHRLCGLSCLLRRKNASLHLRCVALFSAAFVETWRAASPLASVFSPIVCRDAFLRLLQRVCHISHRLCGLSCLLRRKNASLHIIYIIMCVRARASKRFNPQKVAVV